MYLYAVALRGDGVAELVREHDGEQGEGQEDAVNPPLRASAAPYQRAPQERKNERDMNLYVDATDLSNLPGPTHARPPCRPMPS